MTSLGQSLVIKFKGHTTAVSTMDDLNELIDGNRDSRVLAMRLMDTLPNAQNPLESDTPETVLRITWGKATRCYSSRPYMTIVTVADWNFSDRFVITSDGQQVGRSTLYRLPKEARIAGIFASRNQDR